jgi:hypothetical protein
MTPGVVDRLALALLLTELRRFAAKFCSAVEQTVENWYGYLTRS